MQDSIIDIIEAINKVDRRFYSYQDIHFCDDELINNERVKHLELRFMNEFSTQFSKVTTNNPSYQKLEHDFEIPKTFMWPAGGVDNSEMSIRRTWEKLNSRYSKETDMIKSFTTIPDFVVHGGANDHSKKNQKLIIEAKVNPRTPKGEIFKDLFHTFIYSNKYNFQCSILMLINMQKHKWVKALKEYISEGYYSGSRINYENIFVIFKPSFDSKTDVSTISNLLDLEVNEASQYACPKCGSSMIKRKAKQGPNAGSYFLGCSAFPICRGARDIT